MTVDHIGIVVTNISDALEYYSDLLGFFPQTERILVEDHDVSVQILTNDDGERVELVEPLSENSPAYKGLKKGKYGGVHHICYRCTDIHKTIERSTAAGCTVASPPAPGIVHGGQMVAFILHPDLGLTEFLEIPE